MGAVLLIACNAQPARQVGHTSHTSYPRPPDAWLLLTALPSHSPAAPPTAVRAAVLATARDVQLHPYVQNVQPITIYLQVHVLVLAPVDISLIVQSLHVHALNALINAQLARVRPPARPARHRAHMSHSYHRRAVWRLVHAHRARIHRALTIRARPATPHARLARPPGILAHSACQACTCSTTCATRTAQAPTTSHQQPKNNV